MATRSGLRAASRPNDGQCTIDSQVVLVLQGGGALGAFQAGVAQALFEAGVEPDWVVGTSIGAINAALIAGNPPERRLERLERFWEIVAGADASLPDFPLPRFELPGFPLPHLPMPRIAGTARAVFAGIPGFFTPQPASWLGPFANLGSDAAGYYSIAPLRETLLDLIDFDSIGKDGPRLTVGAVSVRDGRMRYFDSRDEPLRVEHVMASGALPPAFPPVYIDGEPWWDGGIASNTPIETVFDDRQRRSSVVFAAQVWNPGGPDPRSLWEVMTRHKDIQYASKAHSQVELQERLHHMRHIVRELGKHVAPAERDVPEVRELLSWGCATTMHVVPILIPRIDGEDHTKDIDFDRATVRRRWSLGYEMTRERIAQAPWLAPVAPDVGVLVHDPAAR